MSFIDTNLLSGEEVFFRTKLHWIIFSTPILWLLAAVIFYIYQPGNVIICLLPLLFGIGSTISTLVTYLTSEYGITNKRVLMKYGFIQIRSVDMFINKIESIIVNQSILGRILGFGSIVVCGVGGTKDPFFGIDQPLQFRKLVQEQIEKLTPSAASNIGTSNP